MAQKNFMIGAGVLIVASIITSFFNTALMQTGMALAGVLLVVALWFAARPAATSRISSKDAKTWGVFVIIGVAIQFTFVVPIAFIAFGPAIGSLSQRFRR